MVLDLRSAGFIMLFFAFLYFLVNNILFYNFKFLVAISIVNFYFMLTFPLFLFLLNIYFYIFFFYFVKL